MLCHPEQKVLAQASIHSSEGVHCTGCHGGDATSRDESAAHRGDFESLVDRAGIPRACASCHADLEQMRPYNLPVDQYAMYQTSQHGRALAGGDERVAVCTDCHGVHDIRSPDHPRSPANAANVATTCGACHGDRSLMERYGHDHEIVEEYLSSVHGDAVAAGNTAAPTCINCHGVHGATPPGVGDVGKVCGSCHVQARAAFLAGPHGEGLAAAGLPECESCHANHAILRLKDADLGTLCADCHEQGSEALDVGLKIRALIEGAGEEIEAAEALTLEAAQVPLDVEDHLARLSEAETYVREAQSLVHSVSLEPVADVTRRARSIGQEVQHELYTKLDRTNAHVGLAIFWFYLLMTLAILFGYKRRLRRASDAQ